MSAAANDHTDTGAPKEPPFQEEHFKILLGLDSNDAQEVRMRAALGLRGCLDGTDGQPNMADPAVFFGHWLNKNLPSLLAIAAAEYATAMSLETARRNLATIRDGMAEAPRIITPGGAC